MELERKLLGSLAYQEESGATFGPQAQVRNDSRMRQESQQAEYSPAPLPPLAFAPSVPSQPLPAAQEVESRLRECIARIVQRDQRGLEDLYDATARRVYSVALRILENEEAAEEAVSDAFYQVWREADRYDPARSAVQTWLLVICRSRALDILRRRDPALVHPEPHSLAENAADDRADLQALLEATERGSMVHTALVLVSPLQRQLLALAFFRAHTHSEIAAHLGMPLGSVKSQIRQALRKLREAIGDA